MIFIVSDSGYPKNSGQNSPTEPSQFRVNLVRTKSQISHQETPQSLRKREVALAKISLYIVLVFLLCHIIRIIPNAYEMIQSYNLGVSILVSIANLIRLEKMRLKGLSSLFIELVVSSQLIFQGLIIALKYVI